MNLVFNSLFIICILVLSSCSSSDDSNPTSNSANLPSVQINAPTNVGSNSVTVSGSVSNDGGSPVTSRGFCWSTNPNPDLNDNTVSVGNGTGMFETNISALSLNTDYFIRAYATNSNGTVFSTEISITTLNQCSSIFKGQVSLRTQQDVDDFGAMNYCEVSDCFYLWNDPNQNDPIVDLTPLSGLQKVGCLQIVGNPLLTSLGGLEGIEDVGSLLAITDNLVLLNVNELQSITSTSSLNIVAIHDNESLQDIDGLIGISQMTTLSGSPPQIRILNNPSLMNIDGLINISQIENGYINIDINNSLSNINGLTNMPDNLSSISLFDNQNLTDISGISHYSNFTGSIQIHNCPITNASLQALSGLNTINGSLGLSYLDNITNLDPLSNLNSVGAFSLRNSSNIENLDGLSNMTLVEEDLEIKGNLVLVDLCGLTNLIQNNGLGGQYIVQSNGYNPTIQDILNGDCSL